MPRLPHFPKLYLIADWRAVLRHAWTVRLIAAVFLLQVAELVLPLVGGSLPFPPVVTAILTGLVSAAALVARVTLQKDLSGEKDG